MDPLADKLLVGSLAGAFAFKGLIPYPLLGIILGRDVFLILGSFIIRYREKPDGAHFFDTSQSATFKITPNLLGKVTHTYHFSFIFTSFPIDRLTLEFNFRY